jgi:diaminopimelate epimerase
MKSLQKWHGAGNDFLVDVGDGVRSDWTPEAASAVCDRHTGFGADGLLVADTAGGVLTMTLFNADGSTAEMSGNGIRCLVAAYLRATGVETPTVDVMTEAGRRTVALTMAGDHGLGSVAMGTVSVGTPLAGTLGVANVGNPHVVVLDNPDWTDRDRETLAQQWAVQVGGANVEFVTVIDEHAVAIRVIERGVGWTQACGTGSCATAAVCAARGLTGDVVSVRNPGGELRVTLARGEATLEGPVQWVGTVEWPLR